MHVYLLNRELSEERKLVFSSPYLEQYPVQEGNQLIVKYTLLKWLLCVKLCVRGLEKVSNARLFKEKNS